MRGPLIAIVLVLAVACPTAANAARPVSCSFNYSDRVLRVAVDSERVDGKRVPGVAVITAADGVLNVSGRGGAPVQCRGFIATLFSTASVSVESARPGRPVAFGLDLRRASLGAIPVVAQLGGGELGIALGADSDYVAGGAVGDANALDLDAIASPGVDLTVDAPTTLRLDAGDGNNVVSLGGPGGFAGPWTSPTSIAGRSGDDVLAGGSATDLLFGGDGADEMYGLGGNDLLSADGSGPDTLDCGIGSDVALASNGGDTVRGCELKRRRLTKQPAAPRVLRQLQRLR